MVNVIYFSFFFLSTIASITATAVMFTISRTEASQSVKWIGFVQSHLYRADYLSFTHRLNELVGSIGGT